MAIDQQCIKVLISKPTQAQLDILLAVGIHTKAGMHILEQIEAVDHNAHVKVTDALMDALVS